jgi:hypothetical protein
MSKISIEGNALGSGTFTIASPNSNTSRTLNLPDSSGTVVVTGGAQTIEFAAGTVSAPSITTTGDTNTGIFFPAADTIAFSEGGTEAMRITSDGNVGIRTTSPQTALDVSVGTLDGAFTIGGDVNTSTGARTNATRKYGVIASYPYTNANQRTALIIADNDSAKNDIYIGGNQTLLNAATLISFYTAANNNTASGTERARITSGGYFKASNTGDYVNSTGNYHELRTSESDARYLITSASNASYASDGQLSRINRAANSAYSFLVCESDSGNDIEFKLRGDGNAFADGTWSNNGADYAEFFESVNGEALTLGATVVLDGNKVREATEQDPASAVIGVVRPKEPSKASMIIGNTAWNKWANKYLSDDFDRYIMEDHDVVEWTDEEGKSHSYESQAIPEGITVPADATRKTHDAKGNKFQHYKLNPAWNPDSEYVNRENRPEWNIIGLVGQVKVLKGQPTNDRWVKMRDVSATVEEWFIR